MNKQIYVSIMAALATTAVVWLITLVAAPIAKPLAWALIIGIATLPHHDRLLRKFPGHPELSAGVMVLAITVCLRCRDGEKVVSAAIARFAPDREKARHYCSEIRATTTAVTVGTIFTCLVQGATAGVGYFAAGLDSPRRSFAER